MKLLRKSLLVLSVFASLVFLYATVALAAPPAGNLNQCRNGGDIANPVACTMANGAWVNGNANATQAHYREGDAIPYQEVFTDLVSGQSYWIDIKYQVINNGRHAFDYLTTFSYSEAGADPCNGVPGLTAAQCSAPVTKAIPNDAIVSSGCGFAGTIPSGQVFTLYGGTFGVVGPYTIGLPCPTVPTVDQIIRVNFTATNPTVVLSWGAHLSSQLDWGQNTTVGSISGSSYHTWQEACSFGCGAQDRQLQVNVFYAILNTQVSYSDPTIGGVVTDTVNFILGKGLTAAPKGTVKFYVCGPTGAAPGTPGLLVNGCTPSTPATLVDTQTSTFASLTAVSTPFTVPSQGYYCFRADFTPAIDSPYSQQTHTNTGYHAAGTPNGGINPGPLDECFHATTPTAVTLTDFSARTNDGRGTLIYLFGAAGLLILGTLTVVFSRKR